MKNKLHTTLGIRHSAFTAIGTALVAAITLFTALPLFADYAPASIAGKTIRATISSGGGDLASYGTFDVVTPATGNSYQIVGYSGVASSSGSYSYARLTTTTGSMVMYDSSGVVETVGLQFYSETSGVYSAAVTSGAYGYQNGTFSVTSSSVTPGAVVLYEPWNGATLENRRPTFSWSQSSPAATWYRCYATRDGSKYMDQWTQQTSWTPTADLPAGTYSWWVQTCSAAGYGPWSSSANFTILSAAPAAVVLYDPVGNRTVTAASRVWYSWSIDQAATWYELYVTHNGKMFCDKWFTASDAVAGGGYYECAVDVDGHSAGSYQWYVRGWSPDGMGPWSGPGSFTMPQRLLPGVVTLLTPANNASGVGHQPQFTWTIDSNWEADWYYLYLTRNGSKYLEQWVNYATSGTTWAPTAGLPAGQYKWWVQTWNTSGYGPWSLPGSTFTIQAAVPGAVSLSYPSVLYPQRPGTVRYTWQPDPAATWYELYVLQNGSVFKDKWFTLTDSVDPWGGFAVNVDGHSLGSYQWWVRGWGPDGIGPWSSSLTFLVTPF